MSRDGRIFPARRAAMHRHVVSAPDAVRSERTASCLAAGRTVAQAHPDRLAARLDPDSAAVATCSARVRHGESSDPYACFQPSQCRI